jgi:Flp pilus assembly protein TadD
VNGEQSAANAAIARSVEIVRAHTRNGLLSEAERVCRGLLHEAPQCAEGWNRLGFIMAKLHNALQAVACFERAIAIAPLDPAYHANLGMMYRRANVADKAVACCRRAVELSATHLGARLSLGMALVGARLADEALVHLEFVAQNDPANAHAWLWLGRAHTALRQYEESIAAFRRCAELAPTDAEVLVRLARTRLQAGDVVNALTDARRAVALQPKGFDAAIMLADALLGNCEIAEAETVVEAALTSSPGLPALKFRLAQCRLAQGDYLRGFELYEARLDMEVSNSIRYPLLPMPKWTGEDLAGKRLLVITEQGYGDHIQFCRFIGALADRGAKVVLAASPPLHELMHSLKACSEVISSTADMRQSGCDYWTFIASLPCRLGVAAKNIPQAAYLCANATKRRLWRERLSTLGEGRRIGLVWAGRPEHEYDRRRSIPFAALAPLAAAPDTCWISLQTGPASSPEQQPNAALTVVRFTDEQTFDDSAALMAELNLVISVDTGPAHLCGALGLPIWLLLSKATDWRWNLETDTSPWYPSMRLFRQRNHGDWEDVIRNVVSALRTQCRP